LSKDGEGKSGLSFGVMELFQKQMVVITAQHCEYAIYQWSVHSKMVKMINFISKKFKISVISKPKMLRGRKAIKPISLIKTDTKIL
jgi:hypothetical protein